MDDAAREIVSKHDILTLERCDLAGAHAHDSYQIDDRCETWRHGLIERLKFFRRHIAIGHVRARLADFNQYGRFREQRGAVHIQRCFHSMIEDGAQKLPHFALDGPALSRSPQRHGVSPGLNVFRSNTAHQFVAQHGNQIVPQVLFVLLLGGDGQWLAIFLAAVLHEIRSIFAEGDLEGSTPIRRDDWRDPSSIVDLAFGFRQPRLGHVALGEVLGDVLGQIRPFRARFDRRAVTGLIILVASAFACAGID